MAKIKVKIKNQRLAEGYYSTCLLSLCTDGYDPIFCVMTAKPEKQEEARLLLVKAAKCLNEAWELNQD